MKKLELKHIAPYLPYDLEFKDPETVVPGVMIAICAEMPGLLFYQNKDTIEYFNLNKIKPLLLPLSELNNNPDHVLGLGKIEWNVPTDSAAYTLTQYEYLFSNHFDVFHLIDADLALNKLEQNYENTIKS